MGEQRTRISEIYIKNGNTYPIGTEAKNVTFKNGITLQEAFGDINVSFLGNLATQLKLLQNTEEEQAYAPITSPVFQSSISLTNGTSNVFNIKKSGSTWVTTISENLVVNKGSLSQATSILGTIKNSKWSGVLNVENQNNTSGGILITDSGIGFQLSAIPASGSYSTINNRFANIVNNNIKYRIWAGYDSNSNSIFYHDSYSSHMFRTWYSSAKVWGMVLKLYEDNTLVNSHLTVNKNASVLGNLNVSGNTNIKALVSTGITSPDISNFVALDSIGDLETKIMKNSNLGSYKMVLVKIHEKAAAALRIARLSDNAITPQVGEKGFGFVYKKSRYNAVLFYMVGSYICKTQYLYNTTTKKVTWHTWTTTIGNRVTLADVVPRTSNGW